MIVGFLFELLIVCRNLEKELVLDKTIYRNERDIVLVADLIKRVFIDVERNDCVGVGA